METAFGVPRWLVGFPEMYYEYKLVQERQAEIASLKAEVRDFRQERK